MVKNVDVDIRKDVQSNIILAGGLSLTPGLHNRLSSCFYDDTSLLGITLKHKIIPQSTFPNPIYAAWIGASILSSLGTFQQLWVSREEYNEHGNASIERLCP